MTETFQLYIENNTNHEWVKEKRKIAKHVHICNSTFVGFSCVDIIDKIEPFNLFISLAHYILEDLTQLGRKENKFL